MAYYAPICLDESILSYDDLSYAIEHRLIDVLNVKVGRLGGLIQTRAAILRSAKQAFRIGLEAWLNQASQRYYMSNLLH